MVNGGMLSDIEERLVKKTIHEVRQIARAVGAHSESSQKGKIIETIMSIVRGEITPQSPSKKGAPPKSDNPDLQLVRDINACRQYCLAVKEGKEENFTFGVSADVPSGTRRNFSELTHIYPVERLELSTDGSDIALRMIDFFTPVALGQRAFISSGKRTGRTSLLKSIARGISSKYPDIKVVITLLNARPEEVTEFKREFKNAEICCATFDMLSDKQAGTAMFAFESAKRFTEIGGDAVVLADGLFTSGIDNESLKKLLYCACNAEEGGSLTVIAGIEEEITEYADFISTANMIIYLSQELAKERIFPSIDVKRSVVGREETILSRDGLAAGRNIREKLTSAEIVKLFENFENNSDILEKYKNG